MREDGQSFARACEIAAKVGFGMIFLKEAWKLKDQMEQLLRTQQTKQL